MIALELAHAVAPVHTTGVNWESVITIVLSILVAFATVGAFLDVRLRRRQEDTKNEITEAVSHLSAVLLERLETKENVASLRTEVATLTVKLDLLSRNLSGISGSTSH